MTEENPKQTLPVNQPSAPLPSPKLSESLDGKVQIAEMVTQCFNGLNTYGKDAGQVGDAVKLFLFVLADYQPDEIFRAFRIFLEKNSRMPTPADIVSIIKRGGKQPLCKEVYIALSRKKPEARTFSEDDYMKEYENTMVFEAGYE